MDSSSSSNNNNSNHLAIIPKTRFPIIIIRDHSEDWHGVKRMVTFAMRSIYKIKLKEFKT